LQSRYRYNIDMQYTHVSSHLFLSFDWFFTVTISNKICNTMFVIDK